MRLFDNQHVFVAGFRALLQGTVDLAETGFGAAFGGCAGGNGFKDGFGNVYGFQGFALLVVVFHCQYIRLNHHNLPAFAADAVLQVFAQGGFTCATLTHRRHKAAVAGRLKHGLAHIAHVGGDVEIVRTVDFVVEGVACQAEMAAGGLCQGGFPK